MTTDDQLRQGLDDFRRDFCRLRDEIAKVIVGQRPILDDTLIALIAGGHVLLEGVPGLGKTLLVRTLADALHLDFHRIQFTPDLMPADLIGTNMIAETAEGRRVFEFQRGPDGDGDREGPADVRPAIPRAPARRPRLLPQLPAGLHPIALDRRLRPPDPPDDARRMLVGWDSVPTGSGQRPNLLWLRSEAALRRCFFTVPELD